MWANPAHYIGGGPNQYSSFNQHGPTYVQGPHNLSTQYESSSFSAAPFLSFTNDQADSTPEFFHTESSFMQAETQNFQWQSIPTQFPQIEHVPPEKLSLFYQDPHGQIQGPFLGNEIISWFHEGFFGIDLHVCLSNAPNGTPFQQLGEVMPHLIQKDQPDLNQAQSPSTNDFQPQVLFQFNSFDSAQSSSCQSELAPDFYQTQLNFAEEMIRQNDQIIQAQDQTISKIMSHLSQLSTACKQLELDQESSYSILSPYTPSFGFSSHTSTFSEAEISMPKDIESIDNEEIKENVDLEELEQEASIIEDMKLKEKSEQPNSPFEMSFDDYAKHELDLVIENQETDKPYNDQLLVCALPELEVTLPQVVNEGTVSVGKKLSVIIDHSSRKMDELEILPDIHIDRISLDLRKYVDFPPILDLGKPNITDNISQLANWSTPPPQFENSCVKDYFDFLDHSHIFDTNFSVESQQYASILTKIDLPIENTGQMMEIDNNWENKVQIEVCTTYKDFKLGVEEYFTIDDMILPPPFSDYGSSSVKLDHPWHTSDPWTYTYNLFLKWFNSWNLNEDKIMWWLILKATYGL